MLLANISIYNFKLKKKAQCKDFHVAINQSKAVFNRDGSYDWDGRHVYHLQTGPQNSCSERV